MAIFDIKGYSSKESAELVNQSLAIINYSFRGLSEGLAEGYYKYGMTTTGIVPMVWTGLFGSKTAQGVMSWSGLKGAEERSYQNVVDSGWQRISTSELNYQGKEDKWNAIVGEHPLFRSAQADVLGFRDEQGQLSKITIAFRGITGERENLVTDTLMDVVNLYNSIVKPQPDYLPKAFGDLLQTVAEFAQANGLSGEDIIFTGHSLGGSLVSNMAMLSEAEWDGFYKDSVYISSASSRIDGNAMNVLHYGLENEPVYRVTDSGKIMFFDSLFVHDQEYPNSTDNIVGFNDLYAGKAGLLNWLPYSIANPVSWVTHMPFTYSDVVKSITRSQFYDLTEQDSVIVVSSLSDVTRGNTWVEDIQSATSSHYGKSAFILGSDHDDLLRGGSGNDRLEGFAGDDRFQLGQGHNIVAGGDGNDVLELTHPLSEYSISRDSEGTLYLYHAQQGTLNTLYDVEYLTDNTDNGTTYQINESGLQRVDDPSIVYDYATTATGSADNDQLQLTENGWIFGGDGNDTLTGSDEGLLFFAGKGDDTLVSLADDLFVFNDGDGADVIHGFDQGDRIQLVGVVGLTHVEDLFKDIMMTEQGAMINYGENNSILLVDVPREQLSMDQFILV